MWDHYYLHYLLLPPHPPLLLILNLQAWESGSSTLLPSLPSSPSSLGLGITIVFVISLCFLTPPSLPILCLQAQEITSSFCSFCSFCFILILLASSFFAFKHTYIGLPSPLSSSASSSSSLPPEFNAFFPPPSSQAPSQSSPRHLFMVCLQVKVFSRGKVFLKMVVLIEMLPTSPKYAMTCRLIFGAVNPFTINLPTIA